MANNFAVRPIRVDTAMGSDYLTTIGAVAGTERPLKVKKVLWSAPGTAGTGSFVIQDGSSSNNILLQGNALAATNNPDQQFDFATTVLWRNFKVSTLTGSGVLFIYTE